MDYKTIKDLFAELKEQADELINFGNSKEIAEGVGMLKVINEIEKYCKKNKIALWK